MVAEDLPARGPQPDGSEVVRVLSYNIRSLRDDRTALARVVRACAPDLVCVQESPRFWFPRPQAAWLARSTGLFLLSGGRSASGPLLLGRLRAAPLSVHDMLLPRTPGLHQRGFATTVLRIGRAAPFSLTSCHLSLNADERFAQCRMLLDHLEQVRARSGAAHSIVGGDFNEHPGDAGWELLDERLQDGWATAPWGSEYTSVPERPYQRLDAVFATPGVTVLACGVPDRLTGVRAADLTAATDHLPVLATLRIPAAG
ncbi:endonuclease [Streptacidiphilus sp. PB12-B1b]|uniref:endonuclease/exonuclease/phosphatase family protein n=1 Tax=Streptacidiphilus sp. PB12-B1b TaxID=2705012 RepID=UPI0015FA61C3|nr:endonuclease/exonuclease/phosphatase family protein [Streptacidiphilus sp. PB12-B1b]QMU75877.1 endonuclease [Streptacidiphilus sp. PB12-B1b]